GRAMSENLDQRRLPAAHNEGKETNVLPSKYATAPRASTASVIIPISPVRAELSGPYICKAEGITANSSTPALSLCRELLRAGVDPDRALEIFRAGTLSLRIRTIGEGARLTVKERPCGPVFE